MEIKAEYLGEIIQIWINGSPITFNTNTTDPSEYDYLYNNGFDWVFNII